MVATGICPFDYEVDTGGQSYGQVSTSGTLTGFTPGKTYYVSDNALVDVLPSIVANVKGELVFNRTNLSLRGPSLGHYSLVGSSSTHPYNRFLQYSISTDQSGSYVVFKPATTLTANRRCNPWTAKGGTTLSNDPFNDMINGRYDEFAVPPAANYGTTGLGTGDFELTDGSDHVFWSTHTFGQSNRLVMQHDGNLVVYERHTPKWASGTSGHPGAHLVLQADRNLVIYSATGRALWSSGT